MVEGEILVNIVVYWGASKGCFVSVGTVVNTGAVVADTVVNSGEALNAGLCVGTAWNV